MKPDQALELARTFVDERVRGKWDFELSPPERDPRCPSEWRVYVKWIPIGGGVFDSEVTVVIVDDITERVDFYERRINRLPSKTSL
ncbi:MAG: hypothetical protein ABI353_15900 [Isosphaeraceae bacterium]